jgi:hypothetical protein
VGQFVLIKGRDILGYYPRHEEALKNAYEQLGAGPFLVKQSDPDHPRYARKGPADRSAGHFDIGFGPAIAGISRNRRR